MDCEVTQRLVHGYLDGELDLVRTIEMEEHLRECRTCSLEHDDLLELRSVIGSKDLHFTAPGHLQQRIMTAVRHADATAPRRGVPPWRWIGMAASLAAIAVMAWLVVWRLSGSADEFLTRELVSSHARSLMADHLADVPSADTHTVKPWFTGKLDFSPPVSDLANEGFALLGGRLDYLDGRAVATLIYRRRQHVINLFIWPSADSSPGNNRIVSRHGFTLIHGSGPDMTYWAVSDLDRHELQEFVRLVTKAR